MGARRQTCLHFDIRTKPKRHGQTATKARVRGKAFNAPPQKLCRRPTKASSQSHKNLNAMRRKNTGKHAKDKGQSGSLNYHSAPREKYCRDLKPQAPDSLLLTSQRQPTERSRARSSCWPAYARSPPLSQRRASPTCAYPYLPV